MGEKKTKKLVGTSRRGRPRILPDAADRVRPTAGHTRNELPKKDIFYGCIDQGQPSKRRD